MRVSVLSYGCIFSGASFWDNLKMLDEFYGNGKGALQFWMSAYRQDWEY